MPSLSAVQAFTVDTLRLTCSGAGLQLFQAGSSATWNVRPEIRYERNAGGPATFHSLGLDVAYFTSQSTDQNQLQHLAPALLPRNPQGAMGYLCIWSSSAKDVY